MAASKYLNEFLVALRFLVNAQCIGFCQRETVAIRIGQETLWSIDRHVGAHYGMVAGASFDLPQRNPGIGQRLS